MTFELLTQLRKIQLVSVLGNVIPIYEQIITVAFNTTLTFNYDKYVNEADYTGQSVTFTIAGSGNVNGIGIEIPMLYPTAVAVTGAQELDGSDAIDPAKGNLIIIVYNSDKTFWRNSTYTP
jgi:hypothetical protein